MLCLKVMGELVMNFFNVSQAVEMENECFQANLVGVFFWAQGELCSLFPDLPCIGSLDFYICFRLYFTLHLGYPFSQPHTHYATRIQNMFSMAGSKPHSHRKRMISNAYSKSHINSSAVLSAQTSTILYDRFLPRLHRIHSPQNPAVASPPAGVVDIYELLSAVTMDIVTGYIFGLAAGSNFTADVDSCRHFLGLYSSRRSFNFWPQELPTLTAWLAKLGLRLVPDCVGAANREIESWAVSMCEAAARVWARGGGGREQGGVELVDTPVVYAQLAEALRRESLRSRTAAATAAGEEGSSSSSNPAATEEEEEEQRLTIASELLDHLAAGFDTSGITLTYLVHEVSQQPALQSALRAELLALSPPLVAASAPVLPDPRALDALPLLHAILWETLRLHPAIPGPQPRVTPAGGCALGPDPGFSVPAGVRVSASAGSLHANEEVYEQAGEWRPERWIDVDGEDREDRERRREMDRWFWAFGSGGRMCIGSNLAMYRKSSDVFFLLCWCTFRGPFVVELLASFLCCPLSAFTPVSSSDSQRDAQGEYSLFL